MQMETLPLGERIRKRRDELQLSAAELARRAEVSKGYLSEVESGAAPSPSGAVLLRLAKALGTTIADLLGEPLVPAIGEPPPTLVAFAQQADLTQDDINMLSQIRFRGRQPTNEDDWRFIFESIRRTLDRER